MLKIILSRPATYVCSYFANSVLDLPRHPRYPSHPTYLQGSSSFLRHPFLAVLTSLSFPSQHPRHPFFPCLAILSSMSLPRHPFLPRLAILSSLSLPRCPFFITSPPFLFLPSLKQQLSSPSFPRCLSLSFLSFIRIRAKASKNMDN